MVTIKISKKDSYLLAAIAMLFIGVVYVVAYGGSSPSSMGHSLGEIEVPAGCADGSVLTNTGGVWTCGSASPSSEKIWFSTTQGSTAPDHKIVSLNDNKANIASCKGNTNPAFLNAITFCNLSTSNGKTYLNLSWQESSGAKSSLKTNYPLIRTATITHILASGQIFCRITTAGLNSYKLQIWEDISGFGEQLVCESSTISY
jgi:hypothetical protein